VSFARQFARTQRFTLGEPRNLIVSPDGRRVAFCRSEAGDDPINCLWVLDLVAGTERLVANPRELLRDSADSQLPAAELARRERAREGAGGVVSFATDAAVTVAAFALGGRLFVAGLLSGAARELDVVGPVFDPRPNPTATQVAYVCGATLRIGELNGTSRVIAGPADDEQDVTWGSAEFIAAEEMRRQRGYWWAPDGLRLAVERCDVAAVQQWTIGDPAHPERPAVTHRYPAAGTNNATVELWILDTNGSPGTQVRWDSDEFPYLANVAWTSAGLIITVQSRDQRDLLVLRVDEATGDTTVCFDDHDDQWIELVIGSPVLLEDGRVLTAADRSGARRLVLDGEILSPPDLQVTSIVAVVDGLVTFQANTLDDPTVHQVWQLSLTSPQTSCRCLTPSSGVFNAIVGGPTVAIKAATLAEPGSQTTVGNFTLVSHAQTPEVRPNVTIHRVGDDELAVAVLLPHGPINGPLPVLVDPYGGPHVLRVTTAHNAYLTSQWFADQGFAVIVTDGRGTPGRGSEWERAVHLDLAGPTLDDQVRALEAVTDILSAQGIALDRSRVGIRGWSFGGYLAALAVLQRPGIFHAAIAGAPVTDWRLYDTHYTERYLGDPLTDPATYRASSLIDLAPQLTRPLLLVHGLADDNVVAAHTLRLSNALLEAGRMHEVLPLSGVTHSATQEVVAENLLLHQLAFLRRALGISDERQLL
jgi:dipeptidyl-peptidase 4